MFNRTPVCTANSAAVLFQLWSYHAGSCGRWYFWLHSLDFS